jgi:hypothetical protein
MRIGVGRRGLHRFATNGAASAYPNPHVAVRKSSAAKGLLFAARANRSLGGVPQYGAIRREAM